MNFYDEIEDGVRDWVRRLREAGINTECSCGHEGYIQCQSFDAPTELARIRAALHGHGLWDYEIIFTYRCHGENYEGYGQSIEVRSKAFKARLIPQDGLPVTKEERS